jgi:alanyl-tRNA synthetase
MGPSVEYFVGGLEVGNMVFMQYKTYPDGSRQELQVKVIDVGTGLERVPWLLNGSPTSYVDTFHSALERLQKATGIPYTNPMWDKFGPYSCRLNVDEVDSMEDTWKEIATLLNEDVKVLMDAIQPVKDMYLICDHTRSVMVAVEDGSLPSNVGGAANLRGILRRVFTLLHKNGWWEKLGMEGLMDLFQCHRDSLNDLWNSPPKEYKSFRAIIEIEYHRWLTTDKEAKEKLDKLIKKRKGDLTLDDWVLAVTSYGLDAEKIHELTGMTIPGSLYYEIATREEKSVKQAVGQLYDTAHLPPTDDLFYHGHEHDAGMEATIVTVLPNVEQKLAMNIVVLDRYGRTCIYLVLVESVSLSLSLSLSLTH